jgi:hypothetical protein
MVSIWVALRRGAAVFVGMVQGRRGGSGAIHHAQHIFTFLSKPIILTYLDRSGTKRRILVPLYPDLGPMCEDRFRPLTKPS